MVNMNGLSGRGGATSKHPLAWYMPRFWHGMTLSTWWRELQRNRFAISPSRSPLALTVTGVALANSALATIERLLNSVACTERKLSHPPLFVLGHWRSGTTFLHELLIRDPRHSFANTYQCFAPHHFPLTERLLVPCIRGLMPERRPMDNMAAGWDRPMEDEFALQNLGVPTPYLSTMFPNHENAYPEYLTLRQLTPAQREFWKRALLEFCQRLDARDSRRLVLKSPPHTARIRTLLELFPEAKFVHVSREPRALLRSTLDLWRTLNAEVGLQRVREAGRLENYVIETLQRMYDAYFDDRTLLRSNQLIEVKYEELVHDPLSQLRVIYDRLEIGCFDLAEPAISLHLNGVKNYRRNSHADDDRQGRDIDASWAAYVENFGYASPSFAKQAAA